MSDFTELDTSVVIIGGGIAGALAAIRLGSLGISHILVDAPLPAAEAKIGGFARFSGAKFSLPPAGLGLMPLAGSLKKLDSVINEILLVLGLDGTKGSESADSATCANGIEELRKYDSIVLEPEEVDALLNRLEYQVTSSGKIIYGHANNISFEAARWSVDVIAKIGNILKVRCDSIFYAAGRLSHGLLINAGAIPTDGKGLDVGVRVEFLDRAAVANLRSMGPDAKIIKGACRTFCLNSPGHIYRYEHLGVSIPGGIVAEQSTVTANVGLLLRLKNKSDVLSEVWPILTELDEEFREASKEVFVGANNFKIQPVMRSVFGDEMISEIERFAEHLRDSRLWDKNFNYRIHLPLLDWHWSTFATANSHQTTIPGIYALGDSSGHARGLLQAGISGWLAAEEYAHAR